MLPDPQPTLGSALRSSFASLGQPSAQRPRKISRILNSTSISRPRSCLRDQQRPNLLSSYRLCVHRGTVPSGSTGQSRVHPCDQFSPSSLIMLPSHAAFHRVLLQFCEGVAPNAGKLHPASEITAAAAKVAWSRSMPPRSPSIVVAPAEDRGYHSHISALGLGGRLRAPLNETLLQLLQGATCLRTIRGSAQPAAELPAAVWPTFPIFFTGTGGLIGRGRSVDRVVSRTIPHRSLEGLR